MIHGRKFFPRIFAVALLGLVANTAIAAPFAVPFVDLPEGASGNGGDTSAYFGLQLDPITFDPVYPSPNVYDCTNSVAGGGICRTDFNNFDTRYRYDSVRWLTFDGGRTGLVDSFSWKDRGMAMFRKIYFGYDYDASAPGNVVPAFSQTINYSLYSNYAARPTSQTYQLTTELIVLDHVKLNLDGVTTGKTNPLKLVLDGPNPGITLSHASLLVGTSRLQVTGIGDFGINALQGLNSIERIPNTIISAPTTITISPGAWLSFIDFNKGLEFRGKNNRINAVGLAQDGGLELKRGSLRFDNSIARFSQGAMLHMVGSGTSAVFDDLRFATGAKLAMENGTSITTHTVFMDGGTATLGDQASLVAQTTQINETNQINSRDYTGRFGQVQTNFLGLLDGARLELNGLREFKIKGATDIGLGYGLGGGSGAVLTLNRSDVIAYDTVEMAYGAELNLTDRATFTLRPDNGSHEHPDALLRGKGGIGAAAGAPARIHVGPMAGLNVVYGGQIDLSDEFLHLRVDDTGELAVKGNLRGNGHIEGDGQVVLAREGTLGGQKVSGGWLFPGTRAQPIASLSTDTVLFFGQGSQLRANVGKDGAGQLAYGKVLYGAGNVIFDGDTTLALKQVADQPPLSATDLDGQSITLLAARDAGVSGTIRPSTHKLVVDVSDMPALLTWQVADLQTNRHPDITLEADLLPISGLQKNGGRKTNLARGLSLMSGAAAQKPNGPVAGTLNTLTNAQLGVAGTVTKRPGTSTTSTVTTPPPTNPQTYGKSGAQQNSWHPEPYSSYIATGLAQVANLRNMVFERAFQTNPSGTEAWLDAAGFVGSIDGEDDLGGYSYHMKQLVIGKDMGALWGGAWGGFAAINDRKIDEHDLATQDISGTTLGLGAYWRHQGRTWTTLAQWGLAYGEHDSKRRSTVGSHQTTPRAEYSSVSGQAAVRLSAPWFDYRGVVLSHEVGGSISWYRQEGFDETGDPVFGFRVKAADAEAYIAHVGLHLRFPSVLHRQVGLRPMVFARLEHDFASNDDHAIEASLLANPQLNAEFMGQGRGANSAVTGLNLTTEMPGPWQIQGGFNHAWHSNGRDWGAELNIRYSW